MPSSRPLGLLVRRWPERRQIVLATASLAGRPTEDGVELTVGIEGPSAETLLALRTRVESVGGTVTTSGPTAGEPTVLRATMPTTG